MLYSDSSANQSPKNTAKKSIPPWIPVSLLAVTTAALAVPILLLRKHRAASLVNSLRDSEALPRRAGASSTPLPHLSLPTNPVPGLAATIPRVSQQNPITSSRSRFNPVLYAAKAFGLATLLVGAGSVTAVWGVKSALGVRDTKEFAALMHSVLANRMPTLVSQIHRPLSSTDDENASSFPPEQIHEPQLEDVEWSWPAAEARLKEAFKEGGFSRWMQTALREVEAEARAERAKRDIERGLRQT